MMDLIMIKITTQCNQCTKDNDGNGLDVDEMCSLLKLKRIKGDDDDDDDEKYENLRIRFVDL